MASERRAFTDAQKSEVAEALINGRMTLSEACKRYDIQSSQAYAYLGQYVLSHRDALTPQTVNSSEPITVDARTLLLTAMGEAFARINGITMPDTVR